MGGPGLAVLAQHGGRQSGTDGVRQREGVVSLAVVADRDAVGRNQGGHQEGGIQVGAVGQILPVLLFPRASLTWRVTL